MYVCPKCGSKEIKQDAFIDPNTQELIAVFDFYTCDSCEYTSKYVISEEEYKKAKN